jgi:hypothetical protein
LIQAQLGNKDLALQALEKAFVEGEDLTFLNVEPEWDSIRSDFRFQDLVHRVGLPVNPVAVVVPHSPASRFHWLFFVDCFLLLSWGAGRSVNNPRQFRLAGSQRSNRLSAAIVSG